MMNRTANNRCPVCSLTFSRSSHLQRHYDTPYFAYKAWKCDFCASSFKRCDALRKHWKSCALRKLSGVAIPAQQTPGRRRRACDRCAANKQGCNQVLPCSNCAAASYPCSYERVSSLDTSGNAASWNSVGSILNVETWKALSPSLVNLPLQLSSKWNEQQFSTGTGPCNEGLYEGPRSRLQIGFIIQLTKSSGLYHVFNYTTPDERARSSLGKRMFDSLIDWHDPTWSETSTECIALADNSSVIRTAHMSSWISHPLFSQSTAIWSMIQGHPLFRSSASAELEAEYTRDTSHIQFFNPFNLEKYLCLFWTRWFVHWPVIHQPSFVVEETPTSMIFVMALTGCLMSGEPEDVLSAKKWLEIAEWTVFQDLAVWSTIKQSAGEDSVLKLRNTLKLLQSALLVCTLQHWEGHKESKERIRDQRFPAVVAVARELGFDRAKHATDFDLDQKIVDWPRYILTEELIRTCTYIFLFDNQYAIFHGTPPRIKLSELDMALPHPEPCFRVSTANELIHVLQKLESPSIQNSSIRNLVEHLCTEHEQRDEAQDLAGMSVLGLVTLVVAIQAAILCQTMSLCISPSTISALRNSLNIWNSAWKKRSNVSTNLPGSDTEASSVDDPSTDGWLRHTPEYYWVAALMLDKISFKLGKRNHDRTMGYSSAKSQLEELLEPSLIGY